jgi:type IV pilus assembly protein PilY1
MKTPKTAPWMLLVTLAVTLMSGLARADDTEIFSAASGGTIGPNIMFIIDTSGSMSSAVISQPDYDPTATYPVNQNNAQTNTGNGCSTAFDETAVYWVSASSSSLPQCQATNKIPRTWLNCVTGANALDVTTGYITDAMVQWRKSGSSTFSYAWTASVKASASNTVVACRGDSPSNGPFPTTQTTSSSNAALPAVYTAVTNQNYWTNGSGAQTLYTFYTGKYLNYAYYVTPNNLGTRLSIVKSAAVNLINSLNGVNIGLMRYNEDSNGGSNDTDTQGGRVVYPVSPIATNRAALVTALNGYNANGHTPLSETMFEAYKYFAGDTVLYGNIGSTTATKSAASSRVGGLITGTNYQTPMQYSCQRNFVVFLTDGLPTNDNQADTLITGLPNEATLGGTCSTTYGTAGKCLSALTKYMFNADLSSGLAGQQNVQSYFVGFGDDPQLASAFGYLQNAATKGGGQAYTAGDLTSLQTALTSIVTNILQVSTTFTAPTVAVNAFNRTQTLNDLYVSVFQPASNYHWPGNIKRYLLSNGVITDANGLPAVDPGTGFFQSSAQSFWSPAVDGTNIPVGGAANLLPNWDPTASPHRNVYTFIGANPSAPVTLTGSTNYQVSTSNTLLNMTSLGTATAAAATLVINYARGADIKDENANTAINDTRHTMGDPLHAQPAAVIYGGTTAAPNVTDGVIYAAENDGFLHAISTVTGVELWSFIPQDVLLTLGSLFSNNPTSPKHYTLDGSVRVLKYDVNGDGIVDSAAGDRVFIYVGQGRGGSNYYAFDVTDRNNPKFMWQLGPNELPGIGEAWSDPVLAKVNVNSTSQVSRQKLVLIFAGGYDPAEEVPGYASRDGVGTAIYMVDAVSGALLWQASQNGNGSHAQLQSNRMDHAIPADVSVLDTDGDGYADRMYVGDLAGQIWRFDIYNGQSPANLVTGGVIASLGAHDINSPALADTRRFYNTPDIAVIQRKGQPTYMSIAIGSGYRGHPLNIATQDRFYAVRDYNPFTPLTQAQYNALTPLTDSDLTDITNVLTPTLSQVANGWKLQLATGTSWVGEKALAPASTLNNQVLFTTYTPGMSSSSALTCQPSLGLNKFYAVSVFDGSPVANLQNHANAQVDDRSMQLAQTGIAPPLAFLFPAPTTATDVNGNSLPTNSQSPVLCMAGVEILGACRNFQTRLKTYWNEADAQ